MKKLLVTASLIAMLGSAQAQVLGRAVSLNQTGICPVLGCQQLKEVQISPHVKYVEGRKLTGDSGGGLGGGVAAFYVDGKLAALGWQEVFNYDSLNIGLPQLNQLTRIGVGANVPSRLRAHIGDAYGLDMNLGRQTFPVGNAVFQLIQGGDRRGVLLIDQRYLSTVRSVMGRDDRRVGQALVKDFLQKYGD